MPKVIEALSSIFVRNKSQLQNDAAPVSDGDLNNDLPVPESNFSKNSLSTNPPVSVNNEMGASTSLHNMNAMPMNNILAVNNTQGQVVYQFSHIKGLHMGSVYHINAGKSCIAKESQKGRKTTTVGVMIRSSERLSHKMLDTIATHLGEGWQDVMRELDYSEGQIHQARVDNSNDGGLKEVIYQLLLDWIRNDSDANVGKITQILWRRGHFETINYMKEAWKAEKHFKMKQDDRDISV